MLRQDHIEQLCNRLRLDAGITLTAPQVADLPAQAERIARGLTAHFDANESAFLARQLLYVKVREANVLFPNIRFREFVPISNEVPAGAEQYSIKTWNIAGLAKIVANYAHDFPTANAYVSETLGKVRSVGNSYSYTVQDLRAAAMQPNVSIDQRRADVARLVHERTVETVCAYGDTANGLPGFVNNATVASVSGLTGGWGSATGEVILSDLHKIAQAVVNQSKTIHAPDTMLLPTTVWGLVATKPYSSVVPRTILDVFLESNPYIKNVDQWVLLDAANSNPDGEGARLAYNRIICYERNPANVTFEIPQEFEQFAPQLEGLQYTIPCHSRVGGVTISYPLSVVYADNVV